MEAAIDRIMMTYDLLMNRSAAASAEARVKVTEYVTTLFEAGEKDMHRLTVCGLTYLRELDGTSDPVKAGYTGLLRVTFASASVATFANVRPCNMFQWSFDLTFALRGSGSISTKD